MVSKLRIMSRMVHDETPITVTKGLASLLKSGVSCAVQRAS